MKSILIKTMPHVVNKSLNLISVNNRVLQLNAESIVTNLPALFNKLNTAKY